MRGVVGHAREGVDVSAIASEKPILVLADVCDQCQARARVAQLATSFRKDRPADGRRWFYLCAACCSRVLERLESE